MIRLRSVATLSVALLLGACASVPMRTNLTSEQRSKISELDARIIVVQDEVIVDVKAQNNAAAGAAGGLIGAIIVSTIDSKVTNSRVNDAQTMLGPFYAAIEDVDYRKQFTEAISAGLSAYPIKVGSFTATPRALTTPALEQMRKRLRPGQALLIIAPHYTLSSDFRSFDAESIVTIWFNDDTKLPAQRGVLHYQSAPVGPGGKESIAQWGAQDAVQFRQVLRESIDETLRMAMLDVDTPPDTDATKSQPVSSFPFNTGGKDTEIKGRLVKAGATRAIVLGPDQKLYSLPATATAAVSMAKQ
jgi:hypothetical protein